MAKYRTLQGYPISTWRSGDFFSTTKLHCAWSDRVAVVTAIDTDPSYPYDDGPAAALAYEATIEPFAKQVNSDSELAAYTAAHITVKYTTKGPSWIANHGYIEESYGPIQQNCPVNVDGLEWVDGGALERGDIPSRVTYLAEWRVTWHNILAINAPAYIDTMTSGALMGYTNSNTVYSFRHGWTFPPETLLFTPPTVKVTYGIGKATRATIIASFKVCPWGWNSWWKPAEQDTRWVVHAGTDDRYYQHPLAPFPSSL